jgi:hypothetical protein
MDASSQIMSNQINREVRIEEKEDHTLVMQLSKKAIKNH